MNYLNATLFSLSLSPIGRILQNKYGYFGKDLAVQLNRYTPTLFCK